MKQRPSISIVVPTLNEAGNISLLLKRIDKSMRRAGTDYEVVIVDDHSSDDTVATAANLTSKYPVRVKLKKGKRGKAYSLLEGFDQARHPLTAMIDADLQYPPEELVDMYNLLVENNADVVITERHQKKTSPLRKLSTKVYNFLFARLLFGIRYDTQSGLKLFKSDVLDGVEMDPSPWTFDLEFLVRAFENKRKVISHAIPFNERHAGVTKIKIVSATAEMAKASLKLRWRTSHRKTREGYEANNRFLKRAFGSAIVVALLAAAAISTPRHAHALDFGQLPAIQFADTTSGGGLSRDLKGALQPSSNKSTQASQPAPTSSSQPTSSNVTSIDPTAVVAQTANTPSGTTTAAAPASHAPSATLGTATSTKKFASVYDDGYPNYKLSSATAHTWQRLATLALEIGLVCLAVAGFVLFYRARRTHNYFKKLRS